MPRHLSPQAWLWRLWLACLLLLVALPRAAADGMYFPPAAHPDLPAIHEQVALLSFRDGQETLVVESVASTKSAGDHAWIIPVPARPTKLEPVSPGSLRTLQFCLTPEINLGPPLMVMLRCF